MVTETTIDPETENRVNKWLDGEIDEASKEEIRRLRKEDPQALTDAFYTDLSFGTGGLRGVMGVGTNRINKYVIRAATQGLANYLAKQGGEHSVFIGYDCRNGSAEFAHEAARVLAGNQIRAYVCKELRPTPLVSFGCRLKGCSAGIMVTASHNPPEYNGYKVYWNDGGQILPPHDSGIIDEVRNISDFRQVNIAPADSPLIEVVSTEVDEAYYEAIDGFQHYPEANQKHGANLSVVYANLHGTGITMIPEALKRWGFTTLHHVEEQKEPDGNFPTVEYPNPEERAALALGITKMEQTESDLLLATDPDADRMGIAVTHNGESVLLTGNQIACVALAHLCEALTKQKRMPDNGAFVKTIVTTELFAAIAEKYGKPSFDVLTGFKYIAQKIREWELADGKYQYLFGGEDSYGYLLGTHARDKDAVIACCLIAEAALAAKLEGQTLVDKLQDLYREFGVYRELLESVRFPETKEGRESMATALVGLRKSPPTAFQGVTVAYVEDYKASTRTELATGKTEPIHLPTSDVLCYWLEDGSKLIVRPSGTEPKVKIYCGVKAPSQGDLDQCITEADDYAHRLVQALRSLLQ
jgi:phosphomannomutase